MKLFIDNFAKIKKANIDIDGITVIAGENNTGKSTIGKILFSLFNSTVHIEDKIQEQRYTEILNVCRTTIRNYAMLYGINTINYFTISQNICDSVIEMLNNDTYTIEDARYKMHVFLSLSANLFDSQSDLNEIEDILVHRIDEIVKLSDDKLMLELLTRYFGRVFHNQVNSLYMPDTRTYIDLNLKTRNLKMGFYDNTCIHLEKDFEIINKAIYIDNPFVIDKMQYGNSVDEMEYHLLNLLNNISVGDVMEGLFDSVLTQNKLSDIFDILSDVIPGDLVKVNDNKLFLKQPDMEKPIALDRLSAGMKSFLIIKILLEKGMIQEKDLLILDEPEIHLHPQWQIVYAELIVLLQKYFDLKIVITTHSPYFLDAIHLYSVKHSISDKARYYMTSSDGKWSSVDDVTDNLEYIYQKMANPIQILDTLRHELNNQ